MNGMNILRRLQHYRFKTVRKKCKKKNDNTTIIYDTNFNCWRENAVGLVQMGAAVDDDDDHRLRYKMVPSSQICNKRL